MEGQPAPDRLDVWVDPGCPWSWQTTRWLRDLRDRGILEIRWRLFSLEVNAAGADAPYWDPFRRFGAAHAALVQVDRDRGNASFEALLFALAHRLHDLHEEITDATVRAAAADAGLEDLGSDPWTDPKLVQLVIDEYLAARQLDVFGVPTLLLAGTKPIYGPIIPEAPEDAEALEWWTHVRWLAARPDFFELKRWPRDRKPGRKA